MIINKLHIIIKWLVTIVTAILLYLNWYRYHIPLENDDIALFDYYSIVTFVTLTGIALLKPRNILTEAMLVFTFLQGLGSVWDEINKIPDYVGQSDDNYLIFCIGLTAAFTITRYILQKKFPEVLKPIPLI